MRITDLYSDVVSEDIKYEYKAELNPENPVKWAKTIVGYANGEGELYLSEFLMMEKFLG